MQNEEILRKALDGLMNSKIWSLEDWIYDVRERANLENFKGNSWEHPDVLAYSNAIEAAKEALKLTEPKPEKQDTSPARLIAEIEGLKLTPASSQSKHYEEVNYGIDRVIEYLSNHYAASSATVAPEQEWEGNILPNAELPPKLSEEDSRKLADYLNEKYKDELQQEPKQPVSGAPDFSHTIQELIDFVDRNIHYEYGKRLRTSTAVQLLRDIEKDCNKLKAENDRLRGENMQETDCLSNHYAPASGEGEIGDE